MDLTTMVVFMSYSSVTFVCFDCYHTTSAESPCLACILTMSGVIGSVKKLTRYPEVAAGGRCTTAKRTTHILKWVKNLASMCCFATPPNKPSVSYQPQQTKHASTTAEENGTCMEKFHAWTKKIIPLPPREIQ